MFDGKDSYTQGMLLTVPESLETVCNLIDSRFCHCSFVFYHDDHHQYYYCCSCVFYHRHHHQYY